MVFVAAGVALFALFAMHGLGTHGTAGHAAAVTPEQHAAPGATSYASSAGENSANAAGQSEPRPNDAPGHSSWMLGLCLAVLAGLLLGLSLLRGRCRVTLPDSLLPRFDLPQLLTRDRDPPDPLRLCVIRC